MFKKLLKYDMLAISKLWWIGAVISAGAAIVGAVLLRFYIHATQTDSEDVFLTLLSVLALIASIFCIIAVAISFVFTLVLVFARFYKNFFTDEGYLTFTLPVKRSTLFLSKTVNAAIWYTAHSVVIAISLLIFLILVIPPEEGGFFINFEIFKLIGDFVKLIWSSIGAWLIVYILEALILGFVSILFSITLIYFCISFGSMLVKKAKLLVSIGLYYAFSSCLTAIGQFSMYIFMVFMSSGISILMEDATLNQTCAIFALVIMIIVAALASVAVVLYSATQHILDRKLNLA